MEKTFEKLSYQSSKLVTNRYSTSFSLGVAFLHRSIRQDIHAIYGFVRLADEIVDTFHEFDKKSLLAKFEDDYYQAYNDGISLNPILNSFLLTVKKYNINDELVQAFLKSMRNDLSVTDYDENTYKEYIYGSADVVGLMCLKVFVNGDEQLYNELKPAAMRLGSAFQKTNFLRDLGNDVNELQRRYFPELQNGEMTNSLKKQIVNDIYQDYDAALHGIKRLPNTAKVGVYSAYAYYRQLTKKIARINVNKVMTKRIRISNYRKAWLLARTYVIVRLGIL
jgi:phytoene/squalene synthetase